MWVLKLQLKHDCILGNRCIKFKCRSLGYPLEYYQEKGFTYFLHLETLYGEEDDIKRFLNDLKKDKNVQNIEVFNNTIFFLYKSIKSKMPSQAYLKKIIHIKPVFVDKAGIETWEIGSWDRENINEFIRQIKNSTYRLDFFKILSIKKSRLSHIYFPQIMPNMTKNQKKALQLAIENNYYDYPRKIELRDLAKMMKRSLSTYREHLRIAERKMMESLN